MLGTPEAFDQYGGDETKMLDGPWAELAQAAVGGYVPELSNTRARTGAWSLKFAATANNQGIFFARKVFRAARATQGLALAIWLDELPATNNVIGIQFNDFDNAEQVTVYIQSTGALSAYRGATLLDSSAIGALVAGAWNHLEIKPTIDNSTGAIEVRVNEVTKLNLTGQDTQNTALTEMSQFRIGKLTENGQMQAAWYIDDLIPWDTDNSDPENTVIDFVGDAKVGVLYPIADLAQADWLKSTGVSGYALIDETTPDDADYIYSSVDGDMSEFTLTALPGNTADVIGYCALPRLLKTDAGSVQVAAQFGVGSDWTAMDALPATTAATYWPFVSTVDPSTSAPYSNAASPKLRLERVAP